MMWMWLMVGLGWVTQCLTPHWTQRHYHGWQPSLHSWLFWALFSHPFSLTNLEGYIFICELQSIHMKNENFVRRLSIILAGTILGSSFLLIFLADFISSSQDLILAGKMWKACNNTNSRFQATDNRKGNQWIRCWTRGSCYSNLCFRGTL